MFPLHALTAIAPASPAGAPGHRQAGSTLFLDMLKPGARLHAMVQTRLPYADGEFVVALEARGGGAPKADTKGAEKQLLHMKLPAGARPGDVLDLIFVSREPRPVFMLAPEAPPADPVPLSTTGRFISDLLGRSPSTATSTALAGVAPLLPAPPDDAAQLARSLAGALSRSGLFYESHQAQWLSGARTLAELALEPQARLPQPSRSQPAQPSSSLAPTALLASLAPQEQGGVASNPAATRHDNNPMPHPVHPEAQGLVRQQLEIFESRQVNWQGIAWPGQSMEWEVAEEKPQSPADSGHTTIWKTRLTLVLPNLGRVCASFRLDAGGVDVRVTAADPVTAFMLRSGTAKLGDGLEFSGIKLLGMKVDLEDQGVNKG